MRGAAGCDRGNSGDRLRPRRHRRERWRGLLLRQGRCEQGAGGDGRRRRSRARRGPRQPRLEHERGRYRSLHYGLEQGCPEPDRPCRSSSGLRSRAKRQEMPAVQQTIDQVKRIDVDQYKYGFETDIETVKAPKGLDESTVRFISQKKSEPGWMLEWRLEAYRRWLGMTEPAWANVKYPRIDFQDLYYYAAPKSTEGPKSLDEVDPELL